MSTLPSPPDSAATPALTSAPAVAAPARERRRRRRGTKQHHIIDDRPAGGMAVAIGTLAVAAPMLGGSLTLWAEAVLALATGLLLFLMPAGRPLGRLMTTLGLGLVLLGTLTLFPVSALKLPAWRVALNAIPDLSLPATLSPQPWLTFEGLGLLAVGTFWGLLLFRMPWTRAGRQVALQIYGAGVIVLATASLLALFCKFKVPFWPEVGNSPINFGFFANRNQTSDVLALGGIVLSALASDAMRDNKRVGWFWLGGLVITCLALIAAYSRAGIIIFFAGVVLWALFSTRMSGSAQIASIVASGFLLLLAMLFLFGGETLERFQMKAGVELVQHGDFRTALYQDAWHLAAEAPWRGHGMGNFEPLFARARNASASPNRPIHPESDWLWLAVEMGWGAPLIFLALLALWARQCFPFDPGTLPRLRLAAAVGVIAFVLHGMVDVSGHRLGALWPALFLAGLARRPVEVPLEGLEAWGGWRWRLPAGLAGAICCAFGVYWLASYARPLPTSATHARLVHQIESAPWESDPGVSVAQATAALRIAPLDWNLYFQRGMARAMRRQTLGALEDLGVAEALEPNWTEFCYTAGLVWLGLSNEKLALESWREVLRRPGDDVVGRFRDMIGATHTHPAMREVLRGWAREKRSLLLVFLADSTPLEFDLESTEVLQHDPTLHAFTARQRYEFFSIWSERRPKDFALAVQASPAWCNEAWLLLARCDAAKGEYRAAMKLVQRLGPTPAYPREAAEHSLADSQREFLLNPLDLLKGLAVYAAERHAGKLSDAIETLRHLEQGTRPPSYLWALEADTQSEREEWEAAWTAWCLYYDKHLQEMPTPSKETLMDDRPFKPWAGDEGFDDQ